MTTKNVRLGLIFDDEVGRVVMPLGGLTFFVALVGFFMPSLTGAAFMAYGAAMVILGSLSWLYIQITAAIIIAKIITDCFLLVCFGDHDDLYE